MPNKHGLPFRSKNGDVIWTLINGEERRMTWDEFDELVHSDGYKDYIALPKREFEEYYKRMSMGKSAREYHANAKKKNLNSQSQRH